MRLLQVFLLFALVSAAATAAAQETADRDRLARQAYTAGSQAFEQGDFETALQRFQEAYELSQRAELLYNIAQSLDRLRRDEETLEALRRYLEAAPNTRSRTEVEARITVLQRAVDRRREEDEARQREVEADREERERERAERERERGPAVVAQSRPPLHPALFITVGALALGGAGVAVWTGLETLSHNDDYNASNDLDEARGLYNETETFQTATNVLIFSSAALGVAAIVMAIFTDWGGSSETAQAAWVIPTLHVDPSGATLGAAGAF